MVESAEVEVEVFMSSAVSLENCSMSLPVCVAGTGRMGGIGGRTDWGAGDDVTELAKESETLLDFSCRSHWVCRVSDRRVCGPCRYSTEALKE